VACGVAQELRLVHDGLVVLAMACATNVVCKYRATHPTALPWTVRGDRTVLAMRDVNNVVCKCLTALHCPNSSRRPFRISHDNFNNVVCRCRTPLHRPIVWRSCRESQKILASLVVKHRALRQGPPVVQDATSWAASPPCGARSLINLDPRWAQRKFLLKQNAIQVAFFRGS
jgi:hypothetical protein